MDRLTLGAQGTGASASVGPLVFAKQLTTGSAGSTRDRTIIVRPGGTHFTTITLKGLIAPDASNSANWIEVIGTGTIDGSKPGAYVIGADYLGLKLEGAGGDTDSTLDGEMLSG